MLACHADENSDPKYLFRTRERASSARNYKLEIGKQWTEHGGGVELPGRPQRLQLPGGQRGVQLPGCQRGVNVAYAVRQKIHIFTDLSSLCFMTAK